MKRLFLLVDSSMRPHLSIVQDFANFCITIGTVPFMALHYKTLHPQSIVFPHWALKYNIVKLKVEESQSNILSGAVKLKYKSKRGWCLPHDLII